MQRRSDDLRQLRLVFIGDGAEWIWRRVADIGTPTVSTSWISATPDHLAEVCKVLYGQGTEQFDKQLQQWRDRLREGGAAVIDELGSCATLIAITATTFKRDRSEPRAYQLPAVPRGPLADRQRHRGERLQERRRRADEGQRHDLDPGRGAAHAAAPRVNHEFTLCQRPPTLTTRPSPTCRTAGGCMTVSQNGVAPPTARRPGPQAASWSRSGGLDARRATPATGCGNPRTPPAQSRAEQSLPSRPVVSA